MRTVDINGVTYFLGEEVLENGKNLEIGEHYIEHTQENPDRYEVFKKDYDDELECSFENCWKIIK